LASKRPVGIGAVQVEAKEAQIDLRADPPRVLAGEVDDAGTLPDRRRQVRGHSYGHAILAEMRRADHHRPCPIRVRRTIASTSSRRHLVAVGPPDRQPYLPVVGGGDGSAGNAARTALSSRRTHRRAARQARPVPVGSRRRSSRAVDRSVRARDSGHHDHHDRRRQRCFAHELFFRAHAERRLLDGRNCSPRSCRPPRGAVEPLAFERMSDYGIGSGHAAWNHRCRGAAGGIRAPWRARHDGADV
jgi:hypothetical protein